MMECQLELSDWYFCLFGLWRYEKVGNRAVYKGVGRITFYEESEGDNKVR